MYLTAHNSNSADGTNIEGFEKNGGSGQEFILEKVKNIESDFYDIILSFGFVLGGLIILAQLFLVFQFIRPFFIKRSRNSLSFITSIGSILWLGIAYTAGHAFFSTQLAPLLGVYWVISNHLYFNHDIQ